MKEEYFLDLQRFWNEFDPIGIVRDVENNDEYKSYVIPYYKLLESNKSFDKLKEYIEHTVYEYMGLDNNSIMNTDIDNFVEKTQSWYANER